MTNKEMAKQYVHNHVHYEVAKRADGTEYAKEVSNVTIEEAYLAGLKAGRPKWHKLFKGYPNNVEYWDLPQGNLPKKQDFYFVKLKNGFIKICEFTCKSWDKRKYFYDLHGVKQSNVAEWLEYPTVQEE